jgi:hypothetical protein
MCIFNGKCGEPNVRVDGCVFTSVSVLVNEDDFG